MIVGIMCIMASLFYGITAARQATPLAVRMRLFSSVLFALAAYIWLFRG